LTRVRALLERLWRRFLPRARITVRIVTAVVLAMCVVLLAASAFVFWRVSYALDRQLDQDLRAYTDVVIRAVIAGGQLPADNPGEVAQTYRPDGTLLDKSDRGVRRLVSVQTVRSATTAAQEVDLEPLLPPPARNPYRVRYQRVDTPGTPVVLATAISRRKHDEALRELLLQLTIADLATVLAASVVGWGATRAALGPVENYRRAAATAGGDPSARLPVDPNRDDELTRLGTTLNTLLAEIESGQRRERQFLADASHELRSPLALLAAEVEWARHRPRTPEELDQVLISVGDQTARLARLTDALLDLEEANENSRIRREPIKLSLLVGTSIAPFQAAAAEAGRAIHVTADDTVVSVEPRWIELSLGNLVGNALKHGAGTVEVNARSDQDTIRIEVRDQGEGIPKDLGMAAFERFARADEARTTPGNGLGLAIVDAVVRRHNGHVELIPGGVRIVLSATDAAQR
jgi:two-component system, OmpR family, sensor kinase